MTDLPPLEELTTSIPRYPDNMAPWRSLASAVILQALRDFQQGELHNWEAYEFLASPECHDLLRILGFSPLRLPGIVAKIHELDLSLRGNSQRTDRSRLR